LRKRTKLRLQHGTVGSSDAQPASVIGIPPYQCGKPKAIRDSKQFVAVANPEVGTPARIPTSSKTLSLFHHCTGKVRRLPPKPNHTQATAHTASIQSSDLTLGNSLLSVFNTLILSPVSLQPDPGSICVAWNRHPPASVPMFVLPFPQHRTRSPPSRPLLAAIKKKPQYVQLIPGLAHISPPIALRPIMLFGSSV
jgi:hypothetical protein